MKLNWRDASKELPTTEDYCVVAIGRSLTLHETYFETDVENWFDFYNSQVFYWIYKHELQLP